MLNESIFEVSRAEYKSFVETIKPETRRLEEIQLDKWHKATRIFSKKTGKCLTSRITHLIEDEEMHEPEKYYIFEMPDDDERLAPIPRARVILETKEEVQAFFDGLKKLREKENLNND